jgi:hypothetical protein
MFNGTKGSHVQLGFYGNSMIKWEMLVYRVITLL